MKKLPLILMFMQVFGFAQQKNDSIRNIEEIKFLRKAPTNKEIISVEKDLKIKNLGQDLPILLKNLTSVVATSDAGNGVGYTSFRVRGTDSRSINVMLNGVPYNDSESLGSFFVDVPDITSSASQLILQRGVGSSSNGVSSFGASLNVLSKNPSEKSYINLSNSIGSFKTMKNSVEIGTGALLDGNLKTFFRFSNIKSDGYLDRAFSKLNSYMLNSTYQTDKTFLRYILISGAEITQQAWNGITYEDYLINPKTNYGGAIYNSDGSMSYYDNEIDNYKQQHHQLLWKQKLTNDWLLETTLHYTKGKGYYENYKQDTRLSNYNINSYVSNGVVINRGDLVRQKYLDNDFYGIVNNLYKNYNKLNLHFGLVANQYLGKHYGKVISSNLPTLIINPQNYYLSQSVKNEISGFTKGVLQLNDWSFFLDLQIRTIDYKAYTLMDATNETVDFHQNYSFFNPKAGVSYQAGFGKFNLSYAVANREPSRTDLIENPTIQSENLNDLELGFEKNSENNQFSINFYNMYYRNQLVFSGKLNDVGTPIRTNSGKSIRMGIEVTNSLKINTFMDWSVNINLSKNHNIDFINDNLEVKNTNIAMSPQLIMNSRLSFHYLNSFNSQIVYQFVGEQYIDNSDNPNFKLSNYSLLDVNTNFDFKLLKKNASLQFIVQNLFNRSYINNAYTYDMTAYYYPQATRNFLLGLNVNIN